MSAPAAPSPCLERVTRSHVQEWAAPPERVLPLLTAAREGEWAAGFTPRILHPGLAPGGLHGLFVTGHGGEETLWTMTGYDEDRREVAYFRVVPGLVAVHLRLRLQAAGEGRTRAEVTYTYSALSEAGNARVAEVTEERYRQQMVEWERALNHFLRTGERLGNY